MKTKKFFSLVILLGAILAMSCSKDSVSGMDGSIGPQGPQGEQGIQGPEGPQGPAGQDGESQGIPGPQGESGADGQDGTDGQDGANGNANVISSDWEQTDFSNSFNSFGQVSHIINDSRITQEVLDNYAILGYLSSNQSISQVWQLPVTRLGIDRFSVDNFVTINSYRVVVGTDDPSDTPVNYFIRYILIEHSSISGKGHTIDSIKKMSYQDAMQALDLNK